MRWLRITPPIVNLKTRSRALASKLLLAKTHWLESAQRPADWVMAAISGAVGLKPTLAAVERGATVALANKECLVCAGGLFMRSAAKAGARILPVNSEHNAVFQALGSGNWGDVRRVILTASGGPFRTWSKEAINAATPEQALKHPNWSMGPKVTIDSATLMNKGLEIIEAHHLFALPSDQIDVLVHPQSVVHGLVEFRDGSVVAQLARPTCAFRSPIVWPGRRASMAGGAARLGRAEATHLSRHRIWSDFRRSAWRDAPWKQAGRRPQSLNAADEVAVSEFIAGRISFPAIAALVEATLDMAAKRGLLAEPTGIDAALAVDHIARSLARDLLPEIAVKAS